MFVVCPVCEREVVNAVGRQKYHARCKKTLVRVEREQVPRPQRLALARARIAAYETEQEQRLFVCAQEQCTAFRRTGTDCGTCLFPKCVRPAWSF